MLSSDVCRGAAPKKVLNLAQLILGYGAKTYTTAKASPKVVTSTNTGDQALEIPTMQLEQRIKKELEENPVLELESDNQSVDEGSDLQDQDDNRDVDNEEFTIDDYYEDDEIPTYKLNTNNYSKDDKYIDVPFSVGTSFHESLTEQLSLSDLSERQQQLAEYIIGNIDDDGYLRRDLMSISDDLAFNMNLDVPEEELEEILTVIHDFDPPGVGARDLRECLLLQLDRKEDGDYDLAKTIVRDFFTEFTKKHYDKIKARLELSDDELKFGIDHVLKLNPKPGSSYSNPLNKSNQHIVPDFILDNVDGELSLSLNQRNVPELTINETYQEMLKNMSESQKAKKNDKEALLFVKQKIDSAKWLSMPFSSGKQPCCLPCRKSSASSASFSRMATRPSSDP